MAITLTTFTRVSGGSSHTISVPEAATSYADPDPMHGASKVSETLTRKTNDNSTSLVAKCDDFKDTLPTYSKVLTKHNA